jgi:hypothetical protein
MIFSPISLHLRGRMARVGGISRQALHLLRPRHRQRPVRRSVRSVGTVVQLNGDGLDPVHGLVVVAVAKFQVQGRNFQVARSNISFIPCMCLHSDIFVWFEV